jgi:hypothetical protein
MYVIFTLSPKKFYIQLAMFYRVRDLVLYLINIYYILCTIYIYFFFCGAATQHGSWPPHSRGF